MLNATKYTVKKSLTPSILLHIFYPSEFKLMAVSTQLTFLNEPLPTLCPHYLKFCCWCFFCLQISALPPYLWPFPDNMKQQICSRLEEPMVPSSQGPYSITTVKSLRYMLISPTIEGECWKVEQSLSAQSLCFISIEWVNEF